MSVNGIRGPYSNPIGPRPAAPRSPEGAPRSAPTGPVASPPLPGAAASVTPPPGTDPALWTVLTPDERAYFARLGAMGPLTYGRVLNAQAPAPAPSARGVRLDVKA
jgi:hypothetical protein